MSMEGKIDLQLLRLTFQINLKSFAERQLFVLGASFYRDTVYRIDSDRYWHVATSGEDSEPHITVYIVATTPQDNLLTGLTCLYTSNSTALCKVHTPLRLLGFVAQHAAQQIESQSLCRKYTTTARDHVKIKSLKKSTLSIVICRPQFENSGLLI